MLRRHFLGSAALFTFTSGIVSCSSGGSSSGSESQAPTKILAIGDSIGDPGFGTVAPWPQRVQDITIVPVANFSRQSQTTDYFVGRAGQLMDSELPSHFMILLGTNDARQGRVTSAVSNIQFMINEATRREIKTIVGTVPHNFLSSAENQKAGQISDGIRTLTGASIAEVRNILGPDSSLFPDGLHPNGRGQQLIAELFVGEL